VARHLFYFVGEIAVDFLDALADGEAIEAGDLDRSTKFLRSLLDHLGDRRLIIDGKYLLEQNGFLG